MNFAVPGNVDEADEGVVLPRADPAEAVTLQARSPVGRPRWMTEALGVQRVEGAIVEVAAPLVLRLHAPTRVRASPWRSIR